MSSNSSDHQEDNEGMELVSNPYCSAKIVMGAKGVARVTVSVIRNDLDSIALANQVTAFYETVIQNLENKMIKVDDYRRQLPEDDTFVNSRSVATVGEPKTMNLSNNEINQANNAVEQEIDNLKNKRYRTEE